MADFNPNELVLEKVRSVEEYDPATLELVGRYTQIEDPALNFTADEREVVDAFGSSIMTFYDAEKGSFSFTNSLHSLDLLASQFGTTKEIASTSNKINVPVSEVLPIGTGGAVVLTYTPTGTTGAEIPYVKVINSDNTFGETYEISATAADGKFTLDVDTKTITLPSGVTGRVFVNYEKASDEAVRIVKETGKDPYVRSLLIHAIFHDPCNKNIVYSGVIRATRAQIDPSNIDVNLTSDGKHGAQYKLEKPYCDEKAKLVEVFVSK
ncbi:hypothetical protein [Congzhengia minquanensis]|uniref:Uncharacterized protein n=1 Tax=Congzhengia minquanensis TaxID=2763657 RepID=A0A926HZH3_9FIRM|nr:hypothetical protein [Congzhengia minquanensis]MBC8540846.1 hypothetical protein [Congzhengia minquanensis]